MSKPHKGTIDDWYIASAIGIFGSKAAGKYMCIGTIKDEYVRTSELILWTRNVVETQNSIYTLGRPYAAERPYATENAVRIQHQQ